MTNLEELEKRVLRVIQENSDLRNKVEELDKENRQLLEATQTFETTLMKESKSVQDLEGEKAALRNSIDAILRNIQALEQAN